MKNHIIISLLFLSVGFCQKKKTDEPNPMKGVKTQTELYFHYVEKFGELKEIPTVWKKEKIIYEYNVDGNMVEKLI